MESNQMGSPPLTGIKPESTSSGRATTQHWLNRSLMISYRKRDFLEIMLSIPLGRKRPFHIISSHQLLASQLCVTVVFGWKWGTLISILPQELSFLAHPGYGKLQQRTLSLRCYRNYKLRQY